MAGKFELYKDAGDQFRFRLKAGNNEIILASEAYTTKGAALNGINSVKTHAPDDGCYERKTSTNDKYYFNLRARNHEVIGTSEMYESPDSRENGIASVKTNAPTAEVEDLT